MAVRPSVTEDTIAAVDAVLAEYSDVDPDRIGFEHKIELLLKSYVQTDLRANSGYSPLRERSELDEFR